MVTAEYAGVKVTGTPEDVARTINLIKQSETKVTYYPWTNPYPGPRGVTIYNAGGATAWASPI